MFSGAPSMLTSSSVGERGGNDYAICLMSRLGRSPL
jgi:hypothetical protein